LAIIGRIFIIIAGLASGIAIALFALPSLVFFDSLLGHTNWMAGFMDYVEAIIGDEDVSEDLIRALLSFLWTASVMICALPLILTALAGEVAGLRAPVWYCVATGLLAAAMPWLTRAAFHLEETTSANPLELHLALLFFLTGATGGLVYWLIAGRGAGRSRQEPR